MRRKRSDKLREVLAHLMQILRTASPGTRLPSVRTVARQTNAVPRTVQKAMHVLAREGCVTIVSRGGAVVTGASVREHAAPNGGMAGSGIVEADRGELRSRILADIASGRYAPGELLPPCKQLRHEYGCSYASLRRALAVLTDEQVLSRQMRRYRLFRTSSRSANAFICLVRARNDVATLPVRHLGILRDLLRAATERSLGISHCGARHQTRRQCLGRRVR